RKALWFIECNRRTHILVDGCVAESVYKLRDEGLKAVLLKGQAYARVYPRPEMRQCGDIDLYVGEDSYLPAYSAIKKFGWKREERFLPKTKHYGCWLDGIRIELHRIAGQLPSPAADHEFQLWSRAQLKESREYLETGGEKVNVPTPVFDVVFVFMHLYHHFLNGGTGLRHICDWILLLHTHSTHLDTKELEKLLNQFHLMRGWKKFTPIAVEHLGLPADECPFYSPKYSDEGEKVLSFILKEGNFGRAKQKGAVRPEGYFAGKIYSFRRQSAHMYSKLRIDPNTISRKYFSFIIKGVARVIKDITNRD
ncbi:MAG: nucleotidyltransferase family protein, partial [Allobaculum sp.]|nr:nucleotidyltransferase family protein [Allobaculum sp.]